MRILLVGNRELDNQRGMSRFSEMLCQHLRARGHLVELVQSPPALALGARGATLRGWGGLLDRHILFPMRLRSMAQGFDAVHVCDHEDSMYVAHTAGVPASVTCHDLLDVAIAEGKVPEQHGTASFRARQRRVLRHLLQAKSVVCASWKTSRELAAMREGGRQRRIVIPDAVEVGPAATAIEKVAEARGRLGLTDGERYLVHAGENLWYQNRPGVLRVFRMVRERGHGALRLVIAGVPLTPDMREFAAANLPKGSVIEVASPGNEELWALYAGAAALILPSLYERSAWRIAEAQSCGCPVITSNRAPMTEVGGPAALYIDPKDEVGAAETIAAKLDGLHALRDAGRENAKRFHPDLVFASYESFFQGVLRTRRATDVVVAANEAETAAWNSREG